MRLHRVVLIVAFATGCAASLHRSVMREVDAGAIENALDAYERYRSFNGANSELLAAIAAMVLERHALSDDRELARGAIFQLSIGGTRGRAALVRVSRNVERRMASTYALELLSGRGDVDARALLYSRIDDTDPVICAAAVSATDPISDRERLVSWLGDPRELVRAAAARVLARASSDEDVRLKLESVARDDASPLVREASVRALSEFGEAAWNALHERLSDEASQVRMAAVRAIVRIGRDQDATAALVQSLLAGQPNSSAIEAARLLAVTFPEAPEGETGADYLHAALAATQPALRSQAAIALLSLPHKYNGLAALEQALAQEEDRAIRFAIAAALERQTEGEHELANRVLEDLSTGHDIAAVQAAAVLAERDSAEAVHRLEQNTREGLESMIRRVAARALARANPDRARRLLGDSDPRVQVNAAGGVLGH